MKILFLEDILKHLFTICCIGFGALAATIAIMMTWELFSSGFNITNSCGDNIGIVPATIAITMMSFFAMLAWRAK